MLNRFSKDIVKLDGTLPTSMQKVAISLTGFFVSVIVVVSVFPVFLFPAVCLGILYYRIGIAYLETGRDLQRMESTSRSPVFAYFGELLDGVATVRAFSAEKWFLQTLCSKIDLTLRMRYMFWIQNRWMQLRFDCLGTFGILITCILAISSDSSSVSGWAALAITSAMSFTSSTYWACRVCLILLSWCHRVKLTLFNCSFTQISSSTSTQLNVSSSTSRYLMNRPVSSKTHVLPLTGPRVLVPTRTSYSKFAIWRSSTHQTFQLSCMTCRFP